MKAYTITVNGTAYEVEVEEKGGAVAAAPRAAAPAPRAAAPAPKAEAPKPAITFDYQNMSTTVSIKSTVPSPQIFYTIDAMPGRLMTLMKLNPMYHFINTFRNLVMFGNIPGPNAWIGCILSGLVVFALGLFVFGRLQKDFILYI